jgi:hypothetical protein
VSETDQPDEAIEDDEDDEGSKKPAPDALSRLVELLAEERIIQPSLADFLR